MRLGVPEFEEFFEVGLDVRRWDWMLVPRMFPLVRSAGDESADPILCPVMGFWIDSQLIE
jgi:hypothetical protein